MEPGSNPYQPPRSNVAMPAAAREVIAVGKGRRLGTFLVDYLGFLVLAAVFGFIVQMIFGDAGWEALDRVPDLVFGSIFFFLYYGFFEFIWARTPGKWLFRTVVVDEHGLDPSLRQVLLRTACRLIPFEPFSFFGSAGWHDRISRTKVVSSRRP